MIGSVGVNTPYGGARLARTLKHWVWPPKSTVTRAKSQQPLNIDEFVRKLVGDLRSMTEVWSQES